MHVHFIKIWISIIIEWTTWSYNFLSQKITQYERQIQELREEVVQANQLRKQQLVELGLLREEEKQKMLREHESEVSQYT